MSVRSLVRTALAAFGLAFALAAILPATDSNGVHAQQTPTIQISPASAAPGENITLRGTGWPAGASLVPRLNHPTIPDRSSPLGSAFQVDAGGSFSGQGTVPNALFGGGSRGTVTVVPGSYTVAVSADGGASAGAPFVVGAPATGALLWGEVAFDANGNGQRDAGDVPASWAAYVLATGPDPDSPERQAMTDSRGRYLFNRIEPGSYGVRTRALFRDAYWAAGTTVHLQGGQATRVDLLLGPDTGPVHPERYFQETGFSIDNDAFWDYFTHRGGIRTLGYPISRSFLFQGYPTQFFQRLVLQEVPGQGVQRLNLLDPGLLPYTRINGSQFPPVMEEVKQATPRVDDPDYDVRVIDFVRQYAANAVDGRRTGFFDAFMGTVTSQDAFPDQGGHEELLPLLNLEIWGVPTSRPVQDPNNSQFVYVRFQRGILHYQGQDARGNPVTEGILLGDWFKSLITGTNLPADLEAQARAADSPFLRQYDPNSPNWIARPGQLPETNLSFAFERQ
ncbi:MAG: carboxypeptidase-like regulatory domain-containing protein [Chloroflexota bacterium]